jgi:23S rRNA pseudouridine2605 synthase
MIVLTNDSELTNQLTHPKYKVPKTYLAKVKGHVDGPMVQKLKKGIWLAEGKTGKSSVKVLKSGHEESLVEITISQGLNRQIRRMLARVGIPVKALTRTRIGGLAMGNLTSGQYRLLSKTEVSLLSRGVRN